MDDKIFKVLSGWFDSDLVNVDNPQEVKDAAYSCAADLVRNIPDIGAAIARLTAMQGAWTPAIIGRFINADYNDDW